MKGQETILLKPSRHNKIFLANQGYSQSDKCMQPISVT